jgi:hypothetical protein
MEITVRDQNLPVPQSVTRQLHIKIQNSLTILSSAIFPRAQKHTEITPIILKAAGGQHPYTWEIKQGALPNGVSLDKERNGVPYCSKPSCGITMRQAVTYCSNNGNDRNNNYLLL